MFRKTLIARALTIAFGAAAFTVGISEPVMAQSNVTGNIFGQVENAAGVSINILNTETGAQRKISIGTDGRYQATSMPTGHYKVQLLRNGAVAETIEVDVSVGQGAEASFTAAAAQIVKVTGRRSKIDVSNTNNGTTFSARELARIPITPNVSSIIQLAPNTTRADPRYAAGASFGGGGASENAYYINGFPVTNPLSQLGASELPFGAIKEAQILTGGFGAEFGRSVGGVVNLVTKSGTNNWEIGGSFAITPNSLRSRSRDRYYGVTGAPENQDVIDPVTGKVTKAGTDGTLRQRREDNKTTTYTTGAYVGGPIIKDKLFMFVSAESVKSTFEGVNVSTASTTVGSVGWLDRKTETQRYLGKLDWNITDNHHLELTLIGDDARSDEKLSDYNYATRVHNGKVTSSAHYQNNSNFTPTVGGDAQIIKYTGNLTENLTLTSLYGKSTVDHTNTYDGYDINQPFFQVQAPSSAQVSALRQNYLDGPQQPLTGNILTPGSKDEVTSFRLDLEYKLGRHTIRGGFDNNKLLSKNAGEFTAGGGIWRYFKTNSFNTPISLSTGPKVIVASGGGFGTQGFYVRKRIFNDATSAASDQSAQYIEDKFQVTKNILLTAGFRNEEFSNKNGDGVKFLEQKNQHAPRFSGSWDVNGDASLKVFGSAGRYHIQIPTHIAVRGASRSTFTDQFFTYTGVDKGIPTGLTQLTEPRSSNNEFGQAKDPLVVSTTDLKPTFQDELTLGFEKVLTPEYNFGAKVTYRKLKSTIDDFCDQRPFDTWAAKNNVDTSNWRGFGCATFNPGENNTFLVDFNDGIDALAGKTHTVVKLTKADLGFDSAKRSYFAMDLFLEHPLRNGWYGKVNYTWSRNRGNTEGQTLSDVAQTDVAATQLWDHKELMEFSNGLLPNDRTHQIKAYGSYDITPQWTVGGNFLMASGRPMNCLGNYPDPSVSPGASELGSDYGSAYHYCNGKPSPRGSLGRLPWDISLDMNLVYKPDFVKGLAFKMDVFNVFNKQTVQAIDEQYNEGGTDKASRTNGSVSATYGQVVSYTAPRTVRLTVEYNHKF